MRTFRCRNEHLKFHLLDEGGTLLPNGRVQSPRGMSCKKARHWFSACVRKHSHYEFPTARIADRVLCVNEHPHCSAMKENYGERSVLVAGNFYQYKILFPRSGYSAGDDLNHIVNYASIITCLKV